MNKAIDARRLHEKALVWDNHTCMPFERVEAFLPQLERCRASGINVVGINIGDAVVTLETQMRMAAAMRHYIFAHPQQYVLAQTVADIRRAKSEGKLAVFFDVEGGFALDGQLSVLELYADIGVRWMAMVYNARNGIGSGVHDDEDLGLSKFGYEVIAEMDRVGIVKCCSHTGYRTARDVLEASKQPVIFSHSNPRALRDHPRNIPDDLILLCAKTEGVVCINGVGLFLGDNDISTPTVVDHVDYVVQRVGAEHVGFGLDYVYDQAELDAALAEASKTWPAGMGYAPGIKFVPPEQMPEITEELVKRGYSESDVRKILGENLLRVAERVWK